jgi:hypothetical protein
MEEECNLRRGIQLLALQAQDEVIHRIDGLWKGCGANCHGVNGVFSLKYKRPTFRSPKSLTLDFTPALEAGDFFVNFHGIF